MATLKELQNAQARDGTMPAKKTVWGTEVMAPTAGAHRLMWVHSKFNKETEAYDTDVDPQKGEIWDADGCYIFPENF